jgi:recombination protein RecA
MMAKSSKSKSKAKISTPAAPPEGGDAEKRRGQALDAALTQIEKSYGTGAIMRLAKGQVRNVPGIPTGAMSLDLALGGQGMPRGRICELFGPEGSGKTTVALHVVAGAQQTGGVAAFIDAEHALDPTWARRLGVKLDDLLISQPDTGEQALEICELLVRSNAVDVIVVDSVAALIPRAEIEGEMGDTHVGLQARLMSQAMRKLTGAISKSRTCVIFINQIRMKIGVMFGNPETTPGGNALKFYSSVRIDVRRIGTLKEGDQAVGNTVRARIVKNKVAPPFRTAEFDLMFDSGINRVGDIIDLGVANDVVTKQGAWFSYGDIRLGQGRANSASFLKDNPDLLQEVETAVRQKVMPMPEETSSEEEDAVGEEAKA